VWIAVLVTKNSRLRIRPEVSCVEDPLVRSDPAILTPAIWRETPVPGVIISHIESGHNCPGIRVLDHGNHLIVQNKLSVVWGESNVRAIVCRGNLMAIDIPLPDSVFRNRDNVLRVYGREANRIYMALLLYNTKALLCLNVPQASCIIIRS